MVVSISGERVPIQIHNIFGGRANSLTLFRFDWCFRRSDGEAHQEGTQSRFLVWLLSGIP